MQNCLEVICYYYSIEGLFDKSSIIQITFAKATSFHTHAHRLLNHANPDFEFLWSDSLATSKGIPAKLHPKQVFIPQSHTIHFNAQFSPGTFFAELIALEGRSSLQLVPIPNERSKSQESIDVGTDCQYKALFVLLQPSK